MKNALDSRLNCDGQQLALLNGLLRVPRDRTHFVGFMWAHLSSY